MGRIRVDGICRRTRFPEYITFYGLIFEARKCLTFLKYKIKTKRIKTLNTNRKSDPKGTLAGSLCTKS